MRILFIHEVNYTTKVIYEMHEFPEQLALRGHDVSFFHYAENPAVPKVSLRTTRESIVGRAYPEARLELVTPPTFGGGRFERYAAPVLDLPSLRSEIRRGYDVVVSYAVPTTGWQAVGIADRAQVPLVFRALDVSHQIRGTLLSSLVKVAEKRVYRRATHLSANTHAMAEYCIELSGRTGPTSVDVPPVDLPHFAGSGDSGLRAELDLDEEDRVVLYMGSFFPFSGLDQVIDALVPEFESDPRLRLLLVGGGEQDDALRAQVARLGLEDAVRFTGVIPYAELPDYLAVADVAINPFEPQLLTHVALPHKVLQYMAVGVPAVSTTLRGLRGVLGENSGVTWADTPTGVAAAAVALAHLPPSKRAAIALRQAEVVGATFSKEAAVDGFEAMLKGVAR